MLNIPELERQWRRYKVKQMAPYLGAGSIILTLTLSFVFYTPDEQVVQIPKVAVVQTVVAIPKAVVTQQTPILQAPVVAQEPMSIPTTQRTSQQQNRVLVLEPSMQFIHDFEERTFNDAAPSQLPMPTQVNQTPIYTQAPQALATTSTILTSEAEPIAQIQEQPLIVKTAKQSNIVISEQTSNHEVQDVIKRFKKNKNPALSLFVAKYYYEQKQYDQSYNYALMTNELDSNIEESWLVFAKSLVKLDQKDMAITTLTSYIEYSASSNAKQLLHAIQKGNFK